MALRTSIVYGLVAALWIVFSDRLLAALISNEGLFALLETVKGWAFVAATAILLYVALRKQLERWELESAERGQAETALAISEQRLRLAMEATRDGLWELDVATGRSYFSSAYWRMLGYEPDEHEPIYQSWVDLIHEEDRERAVKVSQDCIENRIDAFQIEFRMRAKNGDWRWILARGKSEKRDDQGRALLLVGTHQDITDRRRAEEERRTVEAQLHQAQKMEAIGQLAGGVAHDFNNLLTVIVGYSELTLAALGPAHPVKGYVEEIKAAGERAASLTRQLLAFSRKQMMVPEVLNLNHVVTDTAKMLQRLIGENIVLTAVLSPRAAAVRVDPGQIQQVVINLAVNARDAMPQGGQLFIETSVNDWDADRCRLHPGSKPGLYALLSVTDTGTGMTPEVKARIFDPFFTTKEAGRGTGLGLATVYGIVQQSGGYIEVSSEVGVGSCFRLYFPAVEAEAAPATARERAEMAPSGDETILLVEDEESVRRIARLALEAYGYTVLAADDGRTAMILAEQFGRVIDLVVTDVVMPEMSGMQLVAKIRARFPTLQVLFVSGYANDPTNHDAVVRASSAYLLKPFSPHQLAAKVRQILDEAGSRALRAGAGSIPTDQLPR